MLVATRSTSYQSTPTATATAPALQAKRPRRPQGFDSTVSFNHLGRRFRLPAGHHLDVAVPKRVATAFLTLCESTTLCDAAVQRWLECILGRYSEPHRHYHTLNHIDAMLRGAREATADVHHPEVMRLAILFHDIIYDPRRRDNEDASMQLFRSFAAEAHLPPACTAGVLHLIGRTKHHRAENSKHADLELFLDLDFEVLSRDQGQYQAYAQQVRREYAHVPDPLFSRARGQLLQAWLDRPTLYWTQRYQAQHERAARRNLQQEIIELKKLTRGLRARCTLVLHGLRHMAHKIFNVS